MRRYSILQAIPLSFFSRDLYRDVARSWRGAGIAYLLLIVALLTLTVVVRGQLSLSRWVNGEAREFVDQVPTIVIRHQVVRVDCPMPCTLHDRKTGAEVAIIDTTGEVTSLEGREARILLTRDHIVFRKSAAETRMFELAKVENFTIDSAHAKRWLGLLSAWASPVMAPFVFIGLLTVRLIQQLLLAAVGFLIGRMAHVALDFGACMRLAAVALTPVLILEPVLELMRARPPGWGTLWCLIALAYMAWAVLANRPGPAAAAEAPLAAPPPQT